MNKHILKISQDFAKADLKNNLSWYWTHCNHAHARENTPEAKTEFLATSTNYYYNELTRIKKALLNGRFYASVMSVSRSGMSRKIKLAYTYKNKLHTITDEKILDLAGCNAEGKIRGCGMDMLFHSQYVLFQNLHRNHKEANYTKRLKSYNNI